MPLLPENELPQYVPEAANMTMEDRAKYLNRANAYCLGVIGGIPTYTPELPAETVKTAVGMAFEIFAEGPTGQTNSVNGNITAAAPQGFYVRKADNPLEVVDKMLLAYAIAFKNGNAGQADNGIMFL